MSLAECLEVSNFKFRQLKKFIISPDGGQSSEKSVGLLTASSRFGFIFAGHSKGFKVLRLSSVLAIDEAESGKNSQKPVEEFPHLAVSLPSDPFLLALSADNMTLAVGIFKGQCAVALLYDIRIFLTTDPAPASFLEIRLSSSPGVSVLDFFWNPSSGDTFAVCLSDGSANVYEISTPNNFKILGSLPSTTGATSLCWSPKGKQLVIGKRDGRLAQYKPNLLDCVKIIEQPTIFQNSMSVTSILWLETHLFAAAYQNPQDDSQPNLVLSSVPKGSNPSYLNFNDVCYGNGDGPAKYWMHHLSAWRTMICCSSSALETAVVGCTEEKGLWVQWILEDTARAELPMVQSKETYPLGMAIINCSENRIVISEHESYPPMPILLLLNNTGQLCPFHIIYTGSTVSLVSPPEALIADVVGRPPSLTSSQPVLAPAPVPVPAPVTVQPVTPPSLNIQSLGQPIHMSTPLDMPSKLESPATPKTNLLQKFTEESPKQTSLFAPLTKPEAQRQEPKPVASRAPQPGAFMFSSPGQSGSLVTSSPKGPMESTFPMSSGSLFRPTNLSSSSALSPLPASTNVVGSSVTSNNSTKGSRPTLTAVAPSKNMLKLTSQDIIKPSADSTYVQAFLDEVQDFQREIEELGSTLAQNIELGTKEEMALIRKSTHDATNFSTEIKKTLQSIQSDVNQLKSALIETFALLEEARSRDLRDRDPVYLNLLRTRALDPCSQRQLKEIRRLAQYVSGQLQEVHLKLDMDWQDELQKPQHKNKTSINKQGLTTLYQALANNLAVIDCLETSLALISQRFKDLKANKEISHSFLNGSLDVNDLSSNLESVSLGNQSAQQQQQQHSSAVSSIKRLVNKTIGRQQENSLREVLTQRPIRVVKAKPIADLSESRLVSALHTMQMNMSNAVKQVEPPSSVQSFQPVQMSQPVLQTVPTLPKTVAGTPLASIPVPGTTLTSMPVGGTPLVSTPATVTPLASIPVAAGVTASSIPIASLAGPPPNVSVAQSTPILSGRITKGQPFKPLPEETKSVPAVSKSAQGLPVLFLTKSHSPVSVSGVHQPQPTSPASTTTPTLAVFSAFQPKVTITPVSSTAGISANGKIASSNAPTPQFSFGTPVPVTSVATSTIITTSSQDLKFHLPTSTNEEKNPCPKFENITPPESPQPSTAKQDGKQLSCSPTEDSKVIQVSLNTAKADGSPTVKVSSLQTSPVQVIAATAVTTTTSSTQPGPMAVSFSFKNAFSTSSNTSPSSGFSLSHLKSPATSSTTSPTSSLVLSSGESGLPANRFQFSTPTWGLGSGSAFSQPKFSFNAAVAEKTNPIAVTSTVTTPSTTSTIVSLASKTPTVAFSSASEKSFQLVSTVTSATTTTTTQASFTHSVIENTSVSSTETKPDPDSSETAPKSSTLAQPAVTSSSVLFVPKPAVTAFGEAATTTTPTPFCQAPSATFSFGTKTTSTVITPAPTESVSTSPITTAVDLATTTCVSSPIFGQQVTTTTSVPTFGGLLSTATSTSASTQSVASVFSSTTAAVVVTTTTTAVAGAAASGGGIFGSTTPDVTGGVPPPMFGQVTTSAPSPFGQPVSETAPISGNPIFSQPQARTGGLFSGTGSNVSFGQPAGGGAGASAFGQPGQSVFGKSQSFGTTAFGQPQPTSTTLSFGTVTGPFGQAVTSSQPAPAFGQTPSFGQAPSFGQPSTFGQKPVFGQAGSSVFGQATSPPTSGSLFGQQQTGSTTTGNTAGSPFSGNFFMGLGGKPSAENAGKNIFATSGGSGAQDSSTLFGAQGASTFGTAAATQAVTGFSGNFSSGGTVAQTGFAAFQQTPPRPSGFGSPPAFGSSPVFSGSPVFGSPTGFGVNNFGMPSPPPPQSSQTFGSFVSTSAPSFDTLAAQSPSFGNLAQQTQPQQTAQMGSPPFGSFGGQSPSGFGSQSSAFSQWRQ